MKFQVFLLPMLKPATEVFPLARPATLDGDLYVLAPTDKGKHPMGRGGCATWFQRYREDLNLNHNGGEDMVGHAHGKISVGPGDSEGVPELGQGDVRGGLAENRSIAVRMELRRIQGLLWEKGRKGI